MKQIPPYFNEIEYTKSAIQVAKFFALWIVPGLISYAIIASGWPIFLQIPLVVVLTIIGGHGLQCIGLLGHEGTHFALHRDRWISAVMGVAYSCFAPFHMDVGFAITHAEHHAFTNTEKDPDHLFFANFKNFWSRLFLARMAASQRYMHATVRLALNRWPATHTIRVGLPMEQMIRLARLNLLLSFMSLCLYAALTYLFPILMLCVLWLPFVAAMLLSGLRPFVEHLDTEPGRGMDSRSWISPIFDALYGSINYHQAHHLWPRVPSYKLKELHQWAQENEVGFQPGAKRISTFREFLQVSASTTSDCRATQNQGYANQI